MSQVHRMRMRDQFTNPVEGSVRWDPVKSVWYSSMLCLAVVGGIITFSWSAGFIAFGLTVFTLCFGHTVGLHRLLIHRSFKCPLWLEYCMVYVGVVTGMGGTEKNAVHARHTRLGSTPFKLPRFSNSYQLALERLVLEFAVSTSTNSPARISPRTKSDQF